MRHLKKLLSFTLCALLALGILPAGIAQAADPVAYYSNFDSGLSTAPTASGYGSNTVKVLAAEGATYSASSGVLHLELTNGNYLRMENTMTDIDTYSYMVVRMKGSYSGWGGTLTGNSIAFWFGSYGTPGAKLYVPAEQLTEDYSDVVIAIPSGYFGSIADNYKASLFITTERGARFAVDIDEIYFTNDEPGTEPGTDEPVVEPTEPEKFIYNDFEAGLGATYETSTATGNGDYMSYVVSEEGQGVNSKYFTWNANDGVLHLENLTNGHWLRTQNTVTGLNNYKYMVVRMKGSYDWAVLEGNALSFKFGSGGAQSATVSMTADQLTEEYSDVVIEIPNPANFYKQSDYIYGLWIGTQRGATFTVDIDEIYFTNDEPGAEPDNDEPVVEPVDDPTDPVKFVYNNFEAGLGTSYEGSTSTGNGDYKSYVVSAEGGIQWSASNGVLSMTLINGSWLRTWNNTRGVGDYKYMVVRMRGASSDPNLTGNALSFKFGSAGKQSAVLVMAADQLTADYSDVYIEIPDNYYNAEANDYIYSLWIGSSRGVTFTVDIDEIYFTNDEPGTEEPETDTPVDDSDLYALGDVNRDDTVDVRDLVRLKKQVNASSVDPIDDIDGSETVDNNDVSFLRKMLLGIYSKLNREFIYTDFSNAIVAGTFVPSGEEGQQVKLMIAEDADYATDSGVFDATLTSPGGYVRFLNTVPLTGTDRTANYRYMVITVKGSAYDSANNRYTSGGLFKVWFGAWGSESKATVVDVDQVSGTNYSKVVIPLTDAMFSGIPDDYVSGLFIKSAGAATTELSIDEILFTNGSPSSNGDSAGTVNLYDFTGMTSSSYYDVAVNGQEAFVYETNVNNRHYSPSGNSADVMDFEKVGVVSFDLSGNALIDVAIPGLSGVTVTPSSAEIVPVIENGHARFTIHTCGQYTVEFNGSHHRALYIFANEIETNPITSSSSTVIYYGPGFHNAGEITLTSGQTLYLAGGAVVQGYVKSSGANNITIKGRGYLDGSAYSRYAADGVTTSHKVPVDLYNCRNVTVKGISCLDPAGWAYNINRCNTVNIENIKVITSRQNGDGVSVQSSSDVFVKDSFLRTWDDTLVVKNYDGYSTGNVRFDNCILWTDLAQSMEIGYETVGNTISDIYFTNITVLHNFHKAVISIHNADRAAVSNVHFENITVEDAQMGQGDGSNCLIDVQVLRSNVWSTDNTRGSINGVTINNVKVLKGNSPSIVVNGYNATHRTSNVTISNVSLPGRNITSVNDPAFSINGYASVTVS